MNRTRWPITYDGVRRDVLQALAELPGPLSYATDHILQRSHNADIDILSPRQDEQKIASLMTAVDRMLDRCEETMQHTGRTLLCWLRSTKPYNCYPKPFTLVGLEASKKKYRRFWKRFVAFKFRAYRIPRDVCRQITGIRFSKKQLNQLKSIWEHRAWSEIGPAQGIWPRPQDRSGNVRDNTDNEEAESKEDWESGKRDKGDRVL
jgi:hypothetical protein